MTDLKRNIQSKINDLLSYFPAVIILGVRQCGKTTLAKMLRPDWRYLDLERSRDYDLISNDFDFFIKENPNSLIIDEAQRFPDLFQELRGTIDKDRKTRGRFLLIGSSSIDLIKNASESLAGRVGIIELSTFKSNEIYSLKLPEFYKIFEKEINNSTIDFLRDITPEISHDQVMNAFLKGGYPEPVLEQNEKFWNAWMDNYIKTYVQRDIRTLFPRLDLIKYQRFISMLSALTGTIINRSQVGRSLDVSEKSIRDYLEIAEGSYIWRNIPSFESSVSKSIVKMPKGNLRDSGLTHFLQGIIDRNRLISHPNVGNAFEAFVSEEIIKGIQATDTINWHYYHFRTRNGSEVDLVLQGPFGILPIEIKFGSTVKQRQLQAIKNFVYKNDLPLGIVINNSERTEMIAERILVVPAACI